MSGERRCCSVQPLRHLRSRSMPPPLVGEALAFRRVFDKTKSVLSKTKPLCQGLPCQGSWRADARLRGWTKDAFRLSGITQVLLCTTSPSSSLRSMPLSPFGTCVPPPPAGGVFPSRGGFGIPSRFPANANQFHRKRNLFAKGSPTRRAVERMRD